MDIGELLSYKPQPTPKRSNEIANDREDYDTGGDKETHEPARKIGRSSNREQQKRTPLSSGGLTEEERLNILHLVETAEAVDEDVLDEPGLKKTLLLFEKRVLKNQEMRIKFPDNPEKFMESELELHDIIAQLHAVATVPDLYPVLISLNAVPSLLELLAHQNTDVSCAIVNLLQELTDVDILHESKHGADVLLDALRKQQVCALLVQNLDRLDETVKEEADGVHNTLAIVENLTEMNPELCQEAAAHGLLQWILKRLKAKAPFDANKLYCSEILSILIQDSVQNRVMMDALDGIDILLQQLAAYKRHDPNSAEEQEFMENLFNCLCSSLLSPENREKFLRGEGLQLMNLMLREKKLSRNGSLKVLDYAMAGPNGKDNSNKFVEILGLRTIFPLFMKTPKKSKKRLLSSDEHEEHVCSIITSMLRNCKGAQRQRLISKFSENNMEKVDRLLELHLKYLEKVEHVDRELEANQSSAEDGDDEDSSYIKRLAGGLFTLQLVDYIIVEIAASSADQSIKQRIVNLLNMRNASMKTIRNVMREFAGNLGDAGEKDWRDQEQAHIIQLVDRF